MGRLPLKCLVALLCGFAVFSFFALAPAAQLGEQGGQPHFTVQVGHNQTFHWVLLNEGNTSIGFQIHIESIAAQDNQTTPTITASPAYGVIPARGSFTVNLTVFIPLNDTPGAATWSTIASAVEASNVSNPGGVVLQEGVAKIVSISAIPSTTTTTSIPTTTIVPKSAVPQIHVSSTLIIAGIGIAIAAGIAGGIYYAIKRKPTKKARKRVGPARARRRKAARKRTSRKTGTKRRAGRRRRR